MLFDLRALGYFVAAYEERSVTAASRRCFVAQPSISIAIKGLEDALATPLFERSRQGLAPTPAAHRLYPRACSLLAQSSAMVRDFRDAPRETLGIFLQDDLMVQPAAPLFAQIAQAWPHTMVRLTASAQEARLRMVAEHCKPPGDTFVPLWREPYVMLVPEQHPLRFKKRFGLADISGPVGTVSYVSQAVKTSAYSALRLMAILTINVGLFNLFPIPALDGWRLFLLVGEGICKRKLPDKAEWVINAAGLALLLLFMCVVTFSDITKLFS